MAQDSNPGPATRHVIHIGFPKCASTFLQDWFAAHPQVAYKPGGLAGSYSIYDLIQSVIDGPEPRQCQVTSAEQISAPKDPEHYGMLDPNENQLYGVRVEKLCNILAGLYPNARILMVTRNWPELAISGYSQLIRQGSDLCEANYSKHVTEEFRDLLPIDFDRVLMLYREHFDDRVLALPYELLVDDRKAFLGKIADFMGVDHFDIAVRRVNESLDDEQLYWYPRIARLLRFVPSEWLRRKLVALHRRMIRIGAWRPVLNLLKLLTGPKSVSRELRPDILSLLELDCEELLKSELYAPYRDLYRGSGGIGAGS